MIHVTNLRLWAHVGVLEHERRDGQWFRIDLRLWLDVAQAARRDDLAESLDYSKAIQALETALWPLSGLVEADEMCSTGARFLW